MDHEGENCDHKEIYDVFVSYSKQDSQWVTETLIKYLEDEGLIVCWDDRDFEPGVSKIQNKIQALLTSTKTVIVFSPSYIEEEKIWHHIQEKQNAMLNFNNLKLIPIVYESCKIPTMFEDLWMLDWSNSAARKFFWNKLLKAIKAKSGHQEKNTPTTQIHVDKKKLRAIRKTSGETAIIADACTDIHDKKRKIKQEKEKERNKNETEDEGHSDFNSDTMPEGYQILQRNTISTLKEENAKIPYHNQGEMKLRTKDSVKGILIPPDHANIFSSPERLTESDEEVRQFLQHNLSSEQHQDEDMRNYDTASGTSEIRGEFDQYRENLSPRLLGHFVPEDGDLSKDDVDNLTFKIEDVYAKGLLGEDVNISNNEKDLNSINLNVRICSKKKYQKFASAQEQMRVLDTLQEWQEKIKRKFEVCNISQRKRTYRRLLEKFNEAVQKTVNGDNDEALLHCLPLLELSERNLCDTVQCCCCDKVFHSGRALEIHLDKCVKVTWMELMKHVPKVST